MYLSPEDLYNLNVKFDLDNFELTIFYYFSGKKESEDQLQKNPRLRVTKIHNVFVVRSQRPVLVLYNPFQHVLEF